MPAFVSTLCICIVFLPMFFLSGVAKFLFVPLAEAVSFAMLASYGWSRTIVPTMAMYLLSSADEYKPKSMSGKSRVFSAATSRNSSMASKDFREGYHHGLASALERPKLFGGLFSGILRAFCRPHRSSRPGFLSHGRRWPDSFALPRTHRPAHRGNRTPRRQVDSAIRETIPRKELQTILDNLGVPYSGINLSYSNSGTFGTSDAEILVQLKRGTRQTHQRLHQ